MVYFFLVLKYFYLISCVLVPDFFRVYFFRVCMCFLWFLCLFLPGFFMYFFLVSLSNSSWFLYIFFPGFFMYFVLISLCIFPGILGFLCEPQLWLIRSGSGRCRVSNGFLSIFCIPFCFFFFLTISSGVPVAAYQKRWWPVQGLQWFPAQ